MADEATTGYPVTAFEADAEFWVLEQLDLLAQVEAQLRAVHHDAAYRQTPEPQTTGGSSVVRTPCAATR
jgi:hypothetical protein